MTKLRFLHIPKTAGNTFRRILKHQYRNKGRFWFSGNFTADIEKFQLLTEDERKNISLFTGHAPIETGIPEADNINIITLLRDPVSRVKSFCQHVSEGKSGYLLKDFPPESFSLDKFLKSGNEELSNLQTKILINKGECFSSNLIKKMSDSEAKDTALQNLTERVSCFGIQEYFNESLINFVSKFNWKTPVYLSVNKKNSGRLIEIKDYHLEQIAELNTIDIELYKAAKKNFMNMIESKDFNRSKVIRFNLMQSIASNTILPCVRIKEMLTQYAIRLFRQSP